MKFAVDIHGVCADKPELWRVMTKAWVDAGHEVHILSGPPMDQIKGELSGMLFVESIHYTHVFSIVDYHRDILKTTMKQDCKGNWHLDPAEGGDAGYYLWDRTKGDYCLRMGVDCIFDDSDAYKYFVKSPTAYCRFYSMDKRKYHVDADIAHG